MATPMCQFVGCSSVISRCIFECLLRRVDAILNRIVKGTQIELWDRSTEYLSLFSNLPTVCGGLTVSRPARVFEAAANGRRDEINCIGATLRLLTCRAHRDAGGLPGSRH